MHQYDTSDIDISELHSPTKRTEFGSIVRKIWTKIALAKLGETSSTSKIPFLSFNEPSDDVQEIYKSKSESATFSFKLDTAGPSLPKEKTWKSCKDLRATTAKYSLPRINDSEFFLPSTSLKDLFQTNNLIDPGTPCSSKQISRYSPTDDYADELPKPLHCKGTTQIFRLSESSEDNSAVVWPTGATRDIPQSVINDDLYLLKTKLQEVFGHDVEIPSTGPEAGKVITSKAYVPVLSRHDDFSYSAYYTDVEIATYSMQRKHDKAVQADISRQGIRKETTGLRVAPFGWLYLLKTKDVQLIDYRVSTSIIKHNNSPINTIYTNVSLFGIWVVSCLHR